MLGVLGSGRLRPLLAAMSAAGLMTLVLVPAALASPAPSAPPQFQDGDGIHVVSVKQLDPRLYSVALLTTALGRPVNARILLPAGYTQQASTRFPVLYLFHGTSGRASDWTVMGHAEEATAGVPLITVMPDAGFDDDGGGWFTNWVDTHTVLGPSEWETFHIDQLIPWIDANLRTIATRDGRAVAGLSQGGFGSTSYAARHPDLFVSVASFSGAPDIDYNPAVAAGATAIIEGTALGLDGVEPEAMFGSRAIDEINWQGHDPTDLIDNLFPVSIYLYTGEGLPGPYDKPTPNPEAVGIEMAVYASAEGFYSRAEQVGLPVHMDDYRYGTHSWGYWSRDLAEYLVPLMAIFAHPPAAPGRISYSSVDPSWSQWGWTVSFPRTTEAWSQLAQASARGFVLTGTGTASVATPADYAPQSLHEVWVTGGISNGRPVLVRADKSGVLHITVPLGGEAPPAVIGEPGLLPGAGVATVDISPATSAD